MFDTDDQKADLWKLVQATDTMPEAPQCQNFPEAFFPTDSLTGTSHEVRWAKEMCGACPIRNLCAGYGVKWERHGIWGGLTPRERDRLRKARGIVLPVETPAEAA